MHFFRLCLTVTFSMLFLLFSAANVRAETFPRHSLSDYGSRLDVFGKTHIGSTRVFLNPLTIAELPLARNSHYRILQLNFDATSLNNFGQITGNSPGFPHTQAVLYDRERLTILPSLPGAPKDSNTFALDINDRGNVVGVAFTPSGCSHGAMWVNLRIIDLGGGCRETVAYGVNNKGAAVGSLAVGDGPQPTLYAVLFAGGRVQTLFSDAVASAINDAGQIVGTYLSQGDGRPFILPAARNCCGISQSSSANDINQQGHVVGTSLIRHPNGNYTYMPYIYANGKNKALGTLPGSSGSSALALNRCDDVVGRAYMRIGQEHDFLWKAGRMMDLNSLVPANFPFVLNSVNGFMAINDKGQILTHGFAKSGNTYASFLLTPI